MSDSISDQHDKIRLMGFSDEESYEIRDFCKRHNLNSVEFARLIAYARTDYDRIFDVLESGADLECDRAIYD